MSRDLPTPAVSILVRGVPGPQGSKRHVGKGVMVESSDKVKPWRQDVKHAALEVVGDDWTLLDGPLAVAMVFAFQRPGSHYGTGRNAHLLRGSAPQRPTGYPDLSKIVRSTEDALTGVVWKDDSRVVEYVRLGKHYAGHGDGVPSLPGCLIQVWPLDALGGCATCGSTTRDGEISGRRAIDRGDGPEWCDDEWHDETPTP